MITVVGHLYELLLRRLLVLFCFFLFGSASVLRLLPGFNDGAGLWMALVAMATVGLVRGFLHLPPMKNAARHGRQLIPFLRLCVSTCDDLSSRKGETIPRRTKKNEQFLRRDVRKSADYLLFFFKHKKKLCWNKFQSLRRRGGGSIDIFLGATIFRRRRWKLYWNTNTHTHKNSLLVCSSNFRSFFLFVGKSWRPFNEPRRSPCRSP